MRAKSWFKAAVLTAAVIVFAAARAAADAPADDLQTLQTSLNSPGSTAVVRDEAARTLVERGSPEALEILRNSFQTPDNQPAQLAIARALQLTANPDPSFIPLLGEKLGDNVRLTQEAFREANGAIDLHVASDGMEAMDFFKAAESSQ